MSIDSVGVVGLGSMGNYYARQLLAGGYDTHAFDVDEAALEAAVDEGATAAEDPSGVLEAVEVLVLALRSVGTVEAVMEGDDGVLAALESGQVVLDCGTTRADVDVRYAREARDRGADLLDTPVTWTGPADGVDMFVGGDRETYEAVRPVIETLAGNHDHYGEVGSGQVVKAAQRMEQTFSGIVNAEVAEFMHNNGIDGERVNDQLGWEFSESYFEDCFLEHDAARAAVDDPELSERGLQLDERGPRPHLAHGAHKDLAYALQIAHASGTAVPMLSTAYEVMKANRRHGRIVRAVSDDSGWGNSSVAYWQRLNRPVEEWRSVLGEE